VPADAVNPGNGRVSLLDRFAVLTVPPSADVNVPCNGWLLDDLNRRRRLTVAPASPGVGV